ncbi:MAG: glycosyltransferase [Anaerolineaceae bacterium]|nr:glycosyltransferase [Anaerolineaceae bacterium]
MPFCSLKHLIRLTDETGLIQHAYYGIPRRRDGYSADDNARALILVAREFAGRPTDQLLDLATRYLAFLQHGLTDQGIFRNIMNYDRRWADLPAGDDCQGRCLWALGEMLNSPLPRPLHMAAEEMLQRAMAAYRLSTWPRTLAFYLLAFEQLARLDDNGGRRWRNLAARAAERLAESLETHSDDGWTWFEDTMTYANARLPHALLAAGRTLDNADYLKAAERALEFLIRETVRDGMLVPVGTRGWYPRGGPKAEFDQQPIEAMAMVEAALAFLEVTGRRQYAEIARTCGRWFLGDNVARVALADPERGSCHDGLHADRVNENEGAESTLAFLISQQALAKHDLS